MENNQSFQYTYSAKEQAGIRRIREKYEEPKQPTMSAMEQVRALDARATQKAMTVSLTVGILGALILGTGMSLIMTELGELLGLGAWSTVIGVAVGLIGLVPVLVAYPLYTATLKRERKRIAPEILRLTDELLK